VAIGAHAPIAAGLFSHFQNSEAVADGRASPGRRLRLRCGSDVL